MRRRKSTAPESRTSSGITGSTTRPEDCLAGGGGMGERMRSKDWADSPLGPVASWPQSLRTSVSICLGTSFPMMIAWGPDLLMLYNDGYVPVLGTLKHPGALGQPLLECFPEIRDLIGPMFRGVMDSGEPVGAEDMMFPLDRHGYTEETYFVFSYSPIRDESGRVGGVLTTCTETTHRVLGERRLRTLSVLADRATHAKTAEDALREASRTFDPAEFPFTLLYLVDPEGGKARLIATSLPDGSAAAEPAIELDEDAGGVWPLRRLLHGGEREFVIELESRLGELPGGPWPEPATQALVLPISRPGLPHPYGFLVAGVSPRRALDDDYRAFFHLVAEHIATAVANASAHEVERRRVEALAELDRAKTAFFSNVSHEFRTPLTMLLGPLEDMLAGVGEALPGSDRAELEAMHRNALRLLKLVNTLLDFARIEAGRAQAAYEPIDLAPVTQELASVFRSMVERAGIRFVVDCPPLPEPVHVDPEMWEKIVLNLVSNAFKFTFEGEITVQLRNRGELVELEVRDTGTGVPRDELPNLFKRFHRVQGARSRSHEGTGIGLALVQDLLRLHGGGITVESELGRGSTFKATVRTGTSHLPQDRIRAARTQGSTAIQATAFVEDALRSLPSERDGAPSTAEAIESREGAPAALATEGARVLVADDNADMRDYLRRILGRHWDVQTVADGADALEESKRHPPDLVLADVMMPGLDGFALLRGLRADERTRHVPLVMLSARAGEEARIEGLEEGADDYLTKPFSARELVARVASQLVLARGRRALAEQRATLYSHFMQAPTPICILRGPEHVIDLANPMCCEVWGRQHRDVIGRPLFEALPEIESQGFKELLEGVLRTGAPYVGKEVPAEVGPGEAQRTIYFNFVYAPLRGLRGDIDGVLVIAFDVTDEIRARDELTRTLRYNEMFTGILGHDLRNPLGAIAASAHVLRLRHPDDSEIVEPAKRILASSGRMSRMIDQLLDFTRIRLAGGIRLERKSVDLGEVLRSVANEIEHASPEGKLRVETLGDATGYWDADRLEQVVSNLAGNAVQHGSMDATPRVRLDGRESTRVILTFENGGAIAQDLLPSLFDPFRGTHGKRDKAKGLGLGLFITKEIVASHGGEVQVESTESQGTRFTVVLPRAVPVMSGATR